MHVVHSVGFVMGVGDGWVYLISLWLNGLWSHMRAPNAGRKEQRLSWPDNKRQNSMWRTVFFLPFPFPFPFPYPFSLFFPFFGFLNSTAGLNSIMRSFQYGCENLHGAVAVRCKNVFKQETHDGKKTKTSSSPKTIIYYTKFTTYYSSPNHTISAAATAHFRPDISFMCLASIYIYIYI